MVKIAPALFCFSVLGAGVAAHAAEPTAHHWTYSGETGPEH